MSSMYLRGARHARPLAVVFALACAAIGVAGHDAHANTWPPPKGTDMSNPANWPNDPGYTTDWNYWSWLPQQTPGARPYVMADKMLGASGMHIDQAWTYTVGRPDVKIAIIDCGIEWDHTDLANKAYLNAAELSGTHAPQNAMGQTCAALTPAALGYDCDGDGIFTVADYGAGDPRVAPMVTSTACNGMDFKGDANGNCILDAGDLIQLFSDGVDDDNNGYTDDISGWDFYKNDNNPYDDTNYGHGSGEAEDSSDEGNNGQGDIGVCPDCRFMMLRAGDSFIADASDFAKGVVYAADNGVKVVQEALGTVDQTAFSKAAIDYAYAHGTTVVASMADENSRHHNMPGVTNHTLPVHAINHDYTMLNDDNGVIKTDGTTFIAFNTCSNYGGQNMLSVSGESCSSEATGKGAGLAGLIYSEGKNMGLDLTPEEVMQLMKMNADLIDVPQSRSTNPDVADQFYESLPYFSQRFGYGRPNMLKTMEAIDAGMIPPEVDLTSPTWFQTLYADRTTSSVPVMGRVAASRAPSYDYIVEWAPGVEPDDALFQPLTNWVRNVNGTTVTGGATMPLGMMTPGQMNTTHVPDPDSRKFGENDRSITLRVRAVAHYPKGDVPGQARRTLAIVNNLPPTPVDGGDLIPASFDGGPVYVGGLPLEDVTKNGLDTDLLPGFPIDMGASVETSAKLADINGDGVRDIVVGASDGSVHVFSTKSGMPVELPGFPYHTNVLDGLNPNLSGEPTVPSYLNAPAYKTGGIDTSIARESIVGSPAVGDVNGDSRNEIVISTWQGTVHVIGSDGKALAGWPKRLPLVPSCAQPQHPSMSSNPPCMDPGHKWSRGTYGSPVLADFDGKPGSEIVQTAFDGNLYVWHGDGSNQSGFPVAIHAANANSYNRILATPAVADFNGDGIPDIATGSNEEVGAGGGSGNYYIVDGRGTNNPGGSPYLPHWPITMVSLHIFPVVAEGTDSAPAIADFTGSGHPEVLLQGNGAPPFILPADPGAQHFPSDPPNRLPIYHSDAGTQVGLDPTSLFGPGTKAFYPDTMFPLFSSPSIGDLDGDGVPDVVMTGGSLSLVGALEGGHPGTAAQELLAMWSGATGHMMYGAPVPIEDFTFLVNSTIADISGDGYPEVLVGTGGYFVRAVDACGCEAKNWPKFTGGWIISTPAVGDITGDHHLEVVTGTRDGFLYAWRTAGTDSGVVQWESFHHDNANTGNYATKLDQGVMRSGTSPIDCALDCNAPAGATTSTQGYSAGGCGCGTVSGKDERTAAFAIALGLGIAGLVTRRRKSR